MTRRERMAMIIAARDAAARNDHATARAIFAGLGISYVTTTTEGN